MNKGDCLYVPSFYFYQIHGKATIQPQKGERKPAAMMLSIRYKTHSDLLAAFFKAIESGKLL